MIDASPLQTTAVFRLGPVPISDAVLTTWVLIAGLTTVCWLGTRRAAIEPGPLQAALEVFVETVEAQLRDILHRDPAPFLPLLGSLLLFLLAANLVVVVPDAKPPTGHIETPAALAVIVLLAVHYFGLREHGIVRHLGRYVRPNPVLLPLNVLAEITRTFSLMIRLFGNMMSHEFVVAIVVFLAGLLVPVPFMLLGILIGVIQAYIFTVLAAVFIGAAVGSVEAG